MTNINLATDRQEERTLGTGTSALFMLLLLLAVAYFGLFFYGKKLNEDSSVLSIEYREKLDTFIVGDSKKVLDFQNRLMISEELLAQERSANEDFGKIEQAMINGVYLGSYKYDDVAKSITLDCYTDKYETIAKQILSFKSSDYFVAVMAGESKFDSQVSRINFPIVLTIK